MFCDIAGSYALLYKNDPETSKQILDCAIQEMASAIQNFGGVVNQVQGDGVMSLFGVPVSMEDQSARACLAASKLVEVFKKRNRDTNWPGDGQAVEIRIGISTGEALVEREVLAGTSEQKGGAYTATGAVSHLAGRLQKLASPFEIVICATTRHAVARYSLSEELADRVVHDRIENHPAPYLLKSINLSRLSTSPNESFFVGRREELLSLHHSVNDVQRREMGDSLCIYGDPGIGKSRLIREFMDSIDLDEFSVHIAYGHSIDTNYPYAIIQRLLYSCYADSTPSNEDQKEQIVNTICHASKFYDWKSKDALRALLGLEPTASHWNDLEAGIRKREIQKCAITLFTRFSINHTVVLIVEDVHLVDDLSRQTISLLSEENRNSKLFIVVSSRIDESLMRPNSARILNLGPLSANDSRQMLQDSDLEANLDLLTIDSLVIRCGGVPLFLEQLSIAQSNALVALESEPTSPGTVITDSIRLIVSSRFERLPRKAKDLLSLASVAGVRFSSDSLVAVGEIDREELYGWIELLISERLINIGNAESEYVFSHAVYHEVIYLNIPRLVVKNIHKQYLKYYMQIDNYGLKTVSPVKLSYHALHSESWDELLEFGSAAVSQALDAAAYNDAMYQLNAIQKALNKSNLTVSKRNASVLLTKSRVFELLGETEKSQHTLNECLEIATQLGEEEFLCEVYAYNTAVCCLHESSTEAISVGNTAVNLADRIQSPRAIFGCSVYLGEAYFFSGKFRKVIDILEPLVLNKTAERYKFEIVGNTAPVAIDCYGILSMAYAQLGEFTLAFQYGQAALTIAKETNRSFDMGLASFYMAYTQVHNGNIETAERQLLNVLENVNSGGVSFLGPWVTGLLGFVHTRQGRLDEGLELVRRSVRDSRVMSMLMFEAYALVSEAYVCMRRGEYNLSENSLNMAEKITDQGGYKSVSMWILRSRSALELDKGNIQFGLDLMQDAIKMASELEMFPDVARCHEIAASYLNNTTFRSEYEEHSEQAKHWYARLT